MTIPQAKITGIIGSNGAGKTTLLRCLTGELTATRGTIYLGDRALHRWPAPQRARMLAYLPQSTSFTFAFTTEELVGLHAASSEAKREALEALELGELASRSLLRLSGGECQRAAIGRVLAQRTPLLLLDEPLAHLDLRHQVGLLELLRQRSQQGVTIIAVLHDLRQARRWCDNLLLLQEGRLLAQGTPEQTLTPQNLRSAFGVTPEALD